LRSAGAADIFLFALSFTTRRSPLPSLYVLPADKLPCGYHRDAVSAIEVFGVSKMALRANPAGSVTHADASS